LPTIDGRATPAEPVTGTIGKPSKKNPSNLSVVPKKSVHLTKGNFGGGKTTTTRERGGVFVFDFRRKTCKEKKGKPQGKRGLKTAYQGKGGKKGRGTHHYLGHRVTIKGGTKTRATSPQTSAKKEG